MPKRISVKGKGADIFFGDYPPPAPNTPEADEGSTPEPHPQHDAPASNVAILQASKLATTSSAEAPPETGRPARHAAGRPAKTRSGPLNLLLPHLSERATVSNTFRFTDRELSSLEDAIYDVSKRFGAKLTKQELVRLGLNAVIADYQERGDASLLGQLATRKKDNA